VSMVITTIIKGSETPFVFFGRLFHTNHWEERSFPLFFFITIIIKRSFAHLFFYFPLF
jgi:hypothetical protein